MDLRYPLEILPKEVWEIIILKVKDSEDLRNLMKASRQLDDVFMKIHHLWLLDKVLPILTATTTYKEKRYLEDEDVLKLRLVDKRWCGAVDSFLENQPNLRPYNESDDKLNSEKHIWSGRSYRHESWDSTTIGRVILREDEYQLGTFGETYEALDGFKNSERNPFPSRSITRYPQQEGGGLWGDYRDVSKKIGKHVWFLSLVWAEENDAARYYGEVKPTSMWKWIVHGLKSLPNLKSLHLEITHTFRIVVDKMAESEVKKFMDLEKNQLPLLPSLESLTIISFHQEELGIPDILSQQLMSTYSLQLRRLQFSIQAWETREKWMFPNLTELSLEDITSSVKVAEVLKSLEAPQLTKLRLSAMNFGGPTNLKMEEDIFPWISLFPSLLYLDIACNQFRISESGAFELPQDSKLPLKYLKIHNSHGITYNFLRFLPSLHRLQISVSEKPIVFDGSAYPEVRLKLEIETNSLYQSNVWEICPKLRSISLYTDYYIGEPHYYEFDRATYEERKDRPGSERVRLRHEVRDFLKLESDSDSDAEEKNEEFLGVLFSMFGDSEEGREFLAGLLFPNVEESEDDEEEIEESEEEEEEIDREDEADKDEGAVDNEEEEIEKDDEAVKSEEAEEKVGNDGD